MFRGPSKSIPKLYVDPPFTSYVPKPTHFNGHLIQTTLSRTMPQRLSNTIDASLSRSQKLNFRSRLFSKIRLQAPQAEL